MTTTEAVVLILVVTMAVEYTDTDTNTSIQAKVNKRRASPGPYTHTDTHSHTLQRSQACPVRAGKFAFRRVRGRRCRGARAVGGKIRLARPSLAGVSTNEKESEKKRPGEEDESQERVKELLSSPESSSSSIIGLRPEQQRRLNGGKKDKKDGLPAIAVDRKQAYTIKLKEAYAKVLSEYNFTSQMSIQTGQQVEQAQQTPMDIQNIAISPRDDDVPNAQVRDTIVIEIRSPDSTLRAEGSTYSNSIEAGSSRRPRLRRRAKSRSKGFYNYDNLYSENHVRTADTDAIFEGDIAERDNDREVADLDHYSNTRKEVGVARPGLDCVANPIAGNVYCAYWKPSKSWYAAAMLPTGAFESIGINGSLSQTSLARYIPACYRSDKQERTVLGWESGYEDGGPKIYSRKFPMLHLKPLNLYDKASRVITGLKAAVNFTARLEAIQEQLSLRKEPTSVVGENIFVNTAVTEETGRMKSAPSVRVQDSNRSKEDNVELGMLLDPISPVTALESNKEQQSSNAAADLVDSNPELYATQLAQNPTSLLADATKLYCTLDDSDRPQTAADLDQERIPPLHTGSNLTVSTISRRLSQVCDEPLAESGMNISRAMCSPDTWPSVLVQKSTNRVSMQDDQPEALGGTRLKESREIREKKRASIDSSSENHVHNNPGGLEGLNHSVESGAAENPGYGTRKAFKADISYILGEPAEEMQTPAVLASTTQTVAKPPPFDCTLPLTTLPALRDTSTSRRV
ncbi:hypothetical protein NUW58_g7308 [Xylaria curta]|uniref:Uncharacterized protein n=1 Tax=Xylaria curta TaxID=42375 RepID=A0ACC1NJB8_9PEZI|nr:hypothetical protein NUW58_g7308 [Xylaria curta]